MKRALLKRETKLKYVFHSLFYGLSLPKRAVMVRVVGRVQRVGYRRFVLDAAQEIGVSGYVRNERDGAVTIMAQGEDEQLEAFLEKIKNPPEPVLIKGFSEKPCRVNPGLKSFEVRFGPLAMELQEGFGAMEKEFRDYREEFRDYREEFRDYRQEFKDYRQEFREFREEFRDYRQEFREFASRTDRNFQILMEKYGEISEKLTQVLETLQRESLETRRELTRAIDTLSDLVKKFTAEKANSTV